MEIRGAYLQFSEIYDRCPDLIEFLSLIKDLDPVETAALLCQMNLDLRLVERQKDAIAKTQQEMGGGLLSDEIIDRLKARLGTTHLGVRPLFHTPQVLNVLRLVIQQNGNGVEKPLTDPEARYKIGTANLMMSDLLVNSEEKVEILSGEPDDRRRALMTQMLCPFEILNTAAMAHIIYRSRIMFRILLEQDAIRKKIKDLCNDFDFEREFSAITGVSLSRWLALLFAMYFYLSQYISADGARHPEYLFIDRLRFRGDCQFSQSELDAVLRTISLPITDFKQLLVTKRPTDWRFDFSPFKSKPLIELTVDKFYCHDIGFLVEKMHSGVFWTINDGLSEEQRPKLFKAWGLLFEAYVNWFLSNRKFNQPILFFPSPCWADTGDESFDGVLMQDSRVMVLEYKGGFLKLEARYSGNKNAFEADLERKIGAGCRQLAKNIESLFRDEPSKRRNLKEVPLSHVTRVLPVLIVQDSILRGPFVNWWLNKRFSELLNRDCLRPGVTVEPLTVASINEIEAMVESAEGGSFNIFEGIQLRCFRDPEMLSELPNFLSLLPTYGRGKSSRIESVVDKQWEEINEYLFGKDAVDLGQESTGTPV